jgi:alanine-glyoxylate transaminase/serine-glyoxylate transaminase/serine-pyruvate transaminase
MSGRHHLFIPGPTNVPDAILRAMYRAQEDQRAPTFPALSRSVLDRLPAVVRSTQATPFVFASTGSAMWEAALVNTVAAGGRVLVPRYGHFSHLFAEAARGLGYRVDGLDAPWGEGAPVEQIEAALVADAAHEIEAVLLVHNETATGVTTDVAAVRAAMDRARHPALLMVDGVSSIGSLTFAMDDWGVDFAITGSQKGFMMPAGLGILYASPKALARLDGTAAPRAYFDLRSLRDQNADGWFPFTPPSTLMHALSASLDLLLGEGMPNVAARHHRLAEGVRRAVHAWGLSLCAARPALYSDTVSTIMVPDGVDARRVIAVAHARWQLALGSGLAQLAGRAFRIGHLGDLNELMLVSALAGTEVALREAGVPVTLGSGVAAATAWWQEHAPAAATVSGR